MSNGSEALLDFKTFAKAEKQRAQEASDAAVNAKQCYWYADDKLSFKRDSLWGFFEKQDEAKPSHCGEIIAAKRAADTMASFDRAYKFRRQARLDNCPRYSCVAKMDLKYWDKISDALKTWAES